MFSETPGGLPGKSTRSALRTRVIATIIGASLAALILLLAETIFFVLNGARERATQIQEPYLFAFSKELGYEALPNLEGRAVKTVRGETIFDVTYRTDEIGRRFTAEPGTEPAEFLAFFGCSFTFGHGLEDSETLPAQAQQRLEGVRAYNYGFAGYGPQQALVKLRSGELAEEIVEPNGTAIYVFMEHHVSRAIGSMRVWTQWGRHFPYFILDDSENLEERGSFVEGRPALSRVYDVLAREQFLRYFEIDVPMRPSDRHLQTTAGIIEAAKSAFLDAYPNGRFVVLIYPESPRPRYDGERFRAMLSEAKVPVIDGARWLDLSDSRYHLPHDGHPNAAANAIVAEKLAASLRRAHE